MAKQRRVNTRFWRDSYIVELDNIEKLLFLYLLTNPETTLSGIYEISIRQIEFDTGVNRDKILATFDKFSQDKKIFHHNGWICLVNHPRHLVNLSENHKKGMIKELEVVPASVFSQIPQDYIKGMESLGIETEYITSSSSFTFTSTSTHTATADAASGKKRGTRNRRGV